MLHMIRTSAILMLAFAGTAIPAHGRIEEVKAYVPVREDFRRVYDLDARNQAKQPFDAYYDWVGKFYGGQTVVIVRVAGWHEVQRTALANVVPARRNRLMQRMNLLGFRAAAEWSKDNSVRRVNRGHITTWGNRLRDAAQANAGGSGDGAPIAKALDEIEKELNQLLKNDPAVPAPNSLTASSSAHRGS